MATVYQNFASGVIFDDPLLISATVINSPSFTYLSTITAPNYMWITIDPNSINGTPEIVKVISHAASSTVVTVLRGQQSTLAHEHPTQTGWVNAPTKADLDPISGLATFQPAIAGGNSGSILTKNTSTDYDMTWIPPSALAATTGFTDLYGKIGAGPPIGTGVIGQTYFDTTNLRLWRSNGTQWIFERAYSTAKRPGVVLSSASQAVGAGGTVNISWTTENSDVDGWITAPSTTLTVPTGWDGCYIIALRVTWSSSASASCEQSIFYNGSNIICTSGPIANAIKTSSGLFHGIAAGGTIFCSAFNGTAGSLNMTCALNIDWLYV